MHNIRLMVGAGLLLLLLSMMTPASAQGEAGWQPTPLWGGWGQAVVFSPAYATDRTLFLGTRKGGVFRSTDGGATFAPSLTAASGLEIYGLAISPTYASDGTLFAAARGGVWRSTDRGSSWTQVYAASGKTFLEVAISPAFATDGVVLASGDGVGVVRSATRGATGSWAAANSGITTLRGLSVAFAPDTPQIAFYGAEAAIFKSVNGGTSWARMTTSGPVAMAGDVLDIAISPRFGSDGHVYLGLGLASNTRLSGAKIWKSTDGGATFTQLPMAGNTAVQDATDFTSVALPPDYDGTDGVADIVFAGRPSWLTFRSDDGGQSWLPLLFPDLDASRIPPDTYDVAVAPTFNSTNPLSQTIASATHGIGLFLSDAGGANWRPANRGMYAHWMYGVTAADDGTLFAAVNGLGVIRSDDGGVQWAIRNDDTAARRLGLHSVYALVAAPDFATSQRLIMGNATNEWEGVLYSTDGGYNWTPAARGSCLSINGSPDRSDGSSDALFRDANVAFLGTKKGLCRSTDGGASWSKIALAGSWVHALAGVPGNPATLFAGTWGNGVYRSTDGGDSWLPSGLSGKQVWQMGISPAFLTDGTIFAALENGGIARSTDGGLTWPVVAFANERIRGVALSPTFATDRTLWIASSTGQLRVSTNGGETWQNTNFPLTEPTRVWLAAGSRKGAAVYAATQGLGLWQLGRVPNGCLHPRDFDGSGRVGAGDFLMVANRWRATTATPDYESRFDLDSDGAIALLDLLALGASFDEGCTPPE